MMDKRLEEIRESIKEIMETPYVARRDKAEKVGIDLVMTGKVDYLIQEVDLLNDQNQRYEQALEEVLFEAYEEAGMHPDTGLQMNTWITRRIEQTLKGESNG